MFSMMSQKDEANKGVFGKEYAEKVRKEVNLFFIFSFCMNGYEEL